MKFDLYYKNFLSIFPEKEGDFSATKNLKIYSINLPCILLKNDQTYFKNSALWTLQDFKSMFCHFTTLYMESLIRSLII